MLGGRHVQDTEAPADTKQKNELEKFIRTHAREDRWCPRVDALRCLKCVEEITAFAITVEVGLFSRFKSARAFPTWTGLVPSEHSSGTRRSSGGVTKTGNSLMRRLLVESAWHYARAGEARKKAPTPEVPLRVENHAAKAVTRLVRRRREMRGRKKRPVVANCATARELACWAWAIGCMAEGAMQAPGGHGHPSCGAVPNPTGRWERPLAPP